MKTRFKYGQEVRITEDGFFKYSFGVVIDCRINEYISMTTDRNELEYLVKLKHNEKWILESNLDEIVIK